MKGFMISLAVVVTTIFFAQLVDKAMANFIYDHALP
jgi:hypothetical protein